MRRFLALLVVSFLFAACGGGEADDGRLSVVAAFFPAAELARAVGGEHVTVTDLTPPNAEPHELEPDSDAVEAIEDADVVVYVGDGFQPAVERALHRSDSRRLDMLSPLKGDPHAWLDPLHMDGVVTRLYFAFSAAAPEHAFAFERRAAAFSKELLKLDEEYRTRLQRCDRRIIVTAHDAFGHLAGRYGLRQEPLTGASPEAEPDPRRQAELLDLIRRDGVTTVFTEDGEEGRATEALAREAGVRTAVLHTLEQRVQGGYLAGMRANLDAIATALGCT